MEPVDPPKGESLRPAQSAIATFEGLSQGLVLFFDIRASGWEMAQQVALLPLCWPDYQRVRSFCQNLLAPQRC